MKASSSFALHGNLVDCAADGSLRCRDDHWLICESGVVTGVYATLPSQFSDIRQEDWGNRLIIPGLVDLHLHAPQYTNMGTNMDLELLQWLDQCTFPEESRYHDAAYAAAAYNGFVDALGSSPTTRAVIFGTVHTDSTLLLMRLLEQKGLPCFVGKVNMDRNAPEALCESTADSLAHTRLWLSQCTQFSHVRPILTPRFIPSCSEALLAGLGALQRLQLLPVQSHLSESPSEVDWVQALCPDSRCYGEAYAQHGLFGGADCPTIMAHCVHSSEMEIELLHAQGVYVAHCPTSNSNLSSGIAPASLYLKRGLHVGLGSDVAGGHTLDLFQIMAHAIQVSKLRWQLLDSSVPPLRLEQALFMATRGGGQFFGQVGGFDAGFACDALILEDDHGVTLPSSQRLERLIYQGSAGSILKKYAAGMVIGSTT